MEYMGPRMTRFRIFTTQLMKKRVRKEGKVGDEKVTWEKSQTTKQIYGTRSEAKIIYGSSLPFLDKNGKDKKGNNRNIFMTAAST